MLRLEIKCRKERRQFDIKLYYGEVLIKDLSYAYIKTAKRAFYIDRGDNPTLVDFIISKLLRCEKNLRGYRYKFYHDNILFIPTTNEVGEQFYQITWNEPGCRYLAKMFEQLIPDLKYTLECHPEIINQLNINGYE